MLQQLALQSSGAGIGVFLGLLIGLSLRKRKGKTEGLLGGSILLTASAAGGLALVVMMAVNYLANT
ncbi:MAG: hypothetical protein ACX93U_02305 [Salipiger thiooxidans]|jgi:hypothetical protein|uniref:Uncharacterized protein n=1 Tax=Salipiger thiooxidans TaxID=282683 RepID=A0A1G7DM93_9RHOB|nr:MULTISPECIES: hypothetical protein [Salipiger]EEX15052.1 hypothetical protein CSE45_2241 [Citreicella sp. SE45]MAU45814.1 hypothetical protein [Salipiger sp.]MBR9836539.1 hypothetical protein [Paracoccaceae bacterium]MBN8186280.1 hypothetical protein [Salipiger thiooxidans]NIY99566.1 hypothetical protein [Salipiger sp. HF18]